MPFVLGPAIGRADFDDVDPHVSHVTSFSGEKPGDKGKMVRARRRFDVAEIWPRAIAKALG
jgi:hypothetical protein